MLPPVISGAYPNHTFVDPETKSVVQYLSDLNHTVAQSRKLHVHGIMTTKGINDGSPHYGIRSIRSEKYKLIWNLTPEVKFQNACTNATEFQSGLALAATGHQDAIAKTKRYQHRPEFELYNILKDPLELQNLADQPKLAEVKKALHTRLQAWMKSWNDEG